MARQFGASGTEDWTVQRHSRRDEAPAVVMSASECEVSVPEESGGLCQVAVVEPAEDWL